MAFAAHGANDSRRNGSAGEVRPAGSEWPLVTRHCFGAAGVLRHRLRDVIGLLSFTGFQVAADRRPDVYTLLFRFVVSRFHFWLGFRSALSLIEFRSAPVPVLKPQTGQTRTKVKRHGTRIERSANTLGIAVDFNVGANGFQLFEHLRADVVSMNPDSAELRTFVKELEHGFPDGRVRNEHDKVAANKKLSDDRDACQWQWRS